MNFSFSGEYRVYFKDTDIGGVVYHARYVDFLEMSRTDFFHSFGYSIRKALEEKKIVFLVVDIHVRYLKPAYLDDVLTVELGVDKIRGAKIFFTYKIFNQGRELLAEASTINTVVDIRRQKPLRIKKVIPELANLVKTN